MFPFGWPSQTKTDPMPARSSPPPKEDPALPRLVICGKCGCTYLGKCPYHTPEEGGYTS